MDYVDRNEDFSSVDNYEKDRYIYELVLSRFNLEWERLSDLDSKASNIIGFVTIVIALEVDLLSNSNKMLADGVYISGHLWTMSSVFALTCALLFGFKSYSIKGWRTAPQTTYLINVYAKGNKTYIETLIQVTKELNFAVEENKVKNEKKAKYISYSLFFLELAAIIFLIVFLFNIII